MGEIASAARARSATARSACSSSREPGQSVRRGSRHRRDVAARCGRRPGVFSRAEPRAVDLEGSPKPVIAAVNGFALGGGCELALACHLRIRRRRGQIRPARSRTGPHPGAGGTQRLPRLIGRGRALGLDPVGRDDRRGGSAADRAWSSGWSRPPSCAASVTAVRRRSSWPRARARSAARWRRSSSAARWTLTVPPCGSRRRCSVSALRPRTCARERARFLEKRKPRVPRPLGHASYPPAPDPPSRSYSSDWSSVARARGARLVRSAARSAPTPPTDLGSRAWKGSASATSSEAGAGCSFRPRSAAWTSKGAFDVERGGAGGSRSRGPEPASADRGARGGFGGAGEADGASRGRCHARDDDAISGSRSRASRSIRSSARCGPLGR